MRDITGKQISLRTASAAGILFCSEETVVLIKNDALPKGNLFDVARAAGFLGAKLTPQLLPHCHPVAIDGLDLTFEFLDETRHKELLPATASARTGILIRGEAKSIGRTGIEMELLTAVSVAALELYDMLKPVDTGLEIGHVRLLEKKGGKTDRNRFDRAVTCAILVCSDTAAKGTREDRSGKLVRETLERTRATVVDFRIVPDDAATIKRVIRQWADDGIRFIFTTGGTGLGPRDVTVEAVREVIEKEAPGIAEAIRNHGQMRTPLAMMSRSVAGTIGKTMIITLPGSTSGARESLDAILPAVFHAAGILDGGGH